MSLSRRDLLVGALGGAAVLALGRRALADALGDRLAAVKRARAGLHTLVGPFTQERTIGLLATKVRSTGTLYLQLPGRLRWELAPPDSIVYWVTPEGLAYRGKNGHGRLPMTERMAPALQDLRAMLGGDIGALRGRYDMKEVPVDGDGVGFEAVPKPGQPSRFLKLTFTLAPDLVRPRKVVLVEGPRDRTEIDFGDLKKNAPIDSTLLRLP